MDIPIKFQDGTFTFTSGDPEDLKDAIVSGLQAVVDGDYIIPGRIGGAQPTDGRVWLNDGAWYYFDGALYRPIKIKVGNTSFQIELISNPTADRTQTLQNKTGTIALTSDIYTPRPTVEVFGTTPNLDWSASNSFFETIGANIVVSFTNSLPGQEIDFVVNANSPSRTVTFPSSVYPVGGALVPQTAPGVDRYHLSNIAGQIYVERFGNYS